MCYALAMARRYDRIDQRPYRLAAPERRANGTWLVEMVLARPGVMQYADGAVYVPPETLADPDWLASMEGVPLIDDDVIAHAEGVDVSTLERERIGTVTGARWDDAQQAVIARAVIDVPRGIEQVRGGRVGVSPAYEDVTEDAEGVAPDGTPYQRIQVRRMRSDNTAITYQPRGGAGVEIRADAQGGTMDDEQAAAEEGGSPSSYDAIRTMIADTVRAAIADAMKDFAPREEEEDDDMESDADTETKRADATVADWRALSEAAEAAGVDLAADATLATGRREVARKIVGDRADTLGDEAILATIATAAHLRADSQREEVSPWAGFRLVADADDNANRSAPVDGDAALLSVYGGAR